MSICWIPRKKLIQLLLYLSIFLITFILISNSYYVPSKIYYYLYPEESINCYRIKKNSLADILDITPEKGNSIFFHETSCSSFFNNKITISSRQACAVESAAKMNPDMEVYLLFTSPGDFKFEDDDESDRMLQALLHYQNVRIMHLDFEKYVQNTPLEELYRTGMIENSDFAKSHASDVLRYLTLWKFGGIYLDLDVVVIKPLKELLTNFAGAESDENVASGVLGFSETSRGHELVESCLNDLRQHFNGHDWGNNGPGVITRLLKSICKANTAKEMITKGCDNFTVYSQKYFYPISWKSWMMYFNPTESEAVFNLTSSSYVIHVWNKHSSSRQLPVTSQAAYLKFARKYCPQIVSQCQKVF